MEYFDNVICIYFFLFFCIKNKWRLHPTYPKREVPLKAPKSLFLEHPNFHDLSHPNLKYKITINQDLPIGRQDLLRTSR